MRRAPSRDEAWALLVEWTKSDSLRKHALAVEAAVRGYARAYGENEDDWGLVALLHDFDYERYPTADDHPFRGCEELRRRGYPEWVTRAILSHASYSGVPRESRLEKTLFACDEMAGFVTAALDRVGPDAIGAGILSPVRTYEASGMRAAQAAGFEPIGRVTMLVREVRSQVREPAMVPVSTR